MMIRPLAWYMLLFALFWTEAHAQFGLHAGTHFSFGNMKNENESLKSRNMSTFDLQAMPGYRLGTLLGGLLLDYRFVGQITDEADAGNDLGGSSFLWGLGGVWEPSMWKFLISYDFRARHTADAINTTYKGSGFHLLAGYEFATNFHADFQYTRMRYNTSDVNDIEQDISSNPVTHWTFGIGISYSY